MCVISAKPRAELRSVNCCCALARLRCAQLAKKRTPAFHCESAPRHQSAAEPACPLALAEATVTDTKPYAPRAGRASKLAALARRACPRCLAITARPCQLAELAAMGRLARARLPPSLPPTTAWMHMATRFGAFTRAIFARAGAGALFFPFFWTCLDFSARYIEEQGGIHDSLFRGVNK